MSTSSEETISNKIIRCVSKNISTRDVDFREFSERMLELEFNCEQAKIVWKVFNAAPNTKDMSALEGFMRI